MAVIVDRKLIKELRAREEKRLQEQTPNSAKLYERARESLIKGVASSYQMRDPYPIYFTHGKGSRVWDVDGREVSDFHNAFGCMVQGHAHPAIVEAVQKRMELGSQFALPTEDSIIVAEHLKKNFKQPRWRFLNSGSEATMDAIRIARAHTGRDPIMKIMGSYHGHHDYVMVSIGCAEFKDRGPRDDYKSTPYGAGIPQGVADMTIPVPFNDADAMENRIERLDRRGPQAGLRDHGAGHDEPGCGAAGARLSRTGSRDHAEARHRAHLRRSQDRNLHRRRRRRRTLRRGPGHGHARQGPRRRAAAGAIGMSEDIAEVVASGKVFQVGTYNGNPLCMAAARASLEEVMTPDAYATPRRHQRPADREVRRHLREVRLSRPHGRHLVEGLRQLLRRARITDYESFIEHQDVELCLLAWIYNINRGIIMAAGREEEWTLSISHDDDDVERWVVALEDIIRDVTR